MTVWKWQEKGLWRGGMPALTISCPSHIPLFLVWATSKSLSFEIIFFKCSILQDETWIGFW